MLWALARAKRVVSWDNERLFKRKKVATVNWFLLWDTSLPLRSPRSAQYLFSIPQCAPALNFSVYHSNAWPEVEQNSSNCLIAPEYCWIGKSASHDTTISIDCWGVFFSTKILPDIFSAIKTRLLASEWCWDVHGERNKLAEASKVIEAPEVIKLIMGTMPEYTILEKLTPCAWFEITYLTNLRIVKKGGNAYNFRLFQSNVNASTADASGSQCHDQ